MQFRKIAAALAVCTALVAASADAAQAQWTVGGATLGGAAKEKVNIAKHTGWTLFLEGTLLGSTLTLTAENVRCAAGVECTIDGANFGNDHSTGVLEFTGMTADINSVAAPKCTVSGGGGGAGTVKTGQLTGEVIMDSKAGSGVVFDKLFPETGKPFASITLSGGECVLGGSTAELTGTATGEVVKTNSLSTGFEPVVTGTQESPWILRFGGLAQETGGGALKMGKSAAFLVGVFDNTLGGVNAGIPFGAD